MKTNPDRNTVSKSPAVLKKRNIIAICIAAVILIIGTVGGYATYSNTGSRLVEKQLSLGEKYLSELNYEAAIVAFTKVISVDPKNVNAYLGLVDAYVGEGKPEKAVETLTNAVAKIPDNADLYSKLADIYISQNDYQNAAEILQKGVYATGNAGLKAKLQDETQEKSQESKPIEDIELTIDSSSIHSENEIYTPLSISDGDNTTAWVENSDSSGVGEWIMFSSDSPFDLDSIQMMNGYSKSESLYYKNNRVAKLEVIASNGESKELYFKDGELDFQEFDIGFEAVTSIKLVIEEVYKGTSYNDLCISELMFNNELLNLNLSENNDRIISKLQQKQDSKSQISDYVGCYSFDNPGGGYYDKDFNLIEEFDWSRNRAQVELFALLENGQVTTNGGAESYFGGMWRVEDNQIVIEDQDYSARYIIYNNMLFKMVDSSYIETVASVYDFKTSETGKIVYIGCAKVPLESWNYPTEY